MKKNLPSGWVMTKLGSVVRELNSGFACGVHNSSGEGIAHLRPMNITAKGAISLKDLRSVTAVSYDKLIKGDVLFNNTNSTELVGKTAYIAEDTDWGYSNHMTRLRFDLDNIDSKLIAYYLHNLFYEGYFRANCNNHVSQASISAKFLGSEVSVPIPPLAEQRRIVAQLDAAMQKLEASQERLEKLPELLKKFRQAVLAAAVSGKLTEAWRAEQSQGETGADLLDRIRAERRAQWEEKQLAKMKGKQLSLNDSWKQKYEEPAAPDASELSELPEGWVWCRLDNVAEMCLGKMLDGAKNQGTPQPYLGNINVRWGSFDLQDVKTMRFTEDEDERYSIKKGDLVICEGGEPGRAAIWESDASIKIQKALHRVRPNTHFLLSHFLFYNLRLDAATGRLNAYFTGTGIQHFTGKALARYIFPMAPFAEQQEIVRQVNHYFDLADQLEARFEQAAALVEQLPQALLAKAFSGELVPQDPNDEPASALLERLKTEAPAPAKGKRGRKPKAMAEAPLFE